MPPAIKCTDQQFTHYVSSFSICPWRITMFLQLYLQTYCSWTFPCFYPFLLLCDASYSEFWLRVDNNLIMRYRGPNMRNLIHSRHLSISFHFCRLGNRVVTAVKILWRRKTCSGATTSAWRSTASSSWPASPSTFSHTTDCKKCAINFFLLNQLYAQKSHFAEATLLVHGAAKRSVVPRRLHHVQLPPDLGGAGDLAGVSHNGTSFPSLVPALPAHCFSTLPPQHYHNYCRQISKYFLNLQTNSIAMDTTYCYAISTQRNGAVEVVF